MLAFEGLHKRPRPGGVVAIGAADDETEFVPRAAAELGNPFGVAAKLTGVLLGSLVAAAAPALISDTPILDIEGFLVAIGGAEVGEGVTFPGWRVAVLNPLVEVARRETADVGGQIGPTTDGRARLHELVGAEGIGILL